MKDKILKVKNHVSRHKVEYAVGVTAAAFLVLIHRNNDAIDAFLIEKGIDPAEYWNPEGSY
jgi:hypothetical protein